MTVHVINALASAAAQSKDAETAADLKELSDYTLEVFSRVKPANHS